jgi:hypothetical protein
MIKSGVAARLSDKFGQSLALGSGSILRKKG